MFKNRYYQVVKQSLITLNFFEVALLLAIMSLAVISFVVKGEFSVQNCISAVSAILGVFCVVLGAKGSIANWIFGLVEGFIHVYICFVTHIYGDFLQRLFWNIPLQVYGWKFWSKRERNDNSTTIHTRYMTWRYRFYTFLSIALGTLALGLFLKMFGPWLIGVLHNILPDMQFLTLKQDYDGDAQLWLDSLTTVLSIVTTYISTKAYVEQWYFWLIINILYIFMWGMGDTEFTFMVVAKYSVYLINSFYGIYMWHKLSKN
ncbi:MAG: nicotinamide riboside transporter PnuC [Bacteroidaceae bacterium]|nr:nicotinamide riboside transporter PnuC [Bacteroidaceae bacterium]